MIYRSDFITHGKRDTDHTIMNKYINHSKAIAYITGIIAILLMLGVWPFGFIHRTHTSESTAKRVMESSEATKEHMLAQVFVSEGTRLNSVDIYVCNDMSGEKIDFAIYDGEFNRIYHKEFIPKDNVSYPGYVHIPVRLTLDRGTPYIYSIYGVDTGIRAGLEDHYTSTNTSLYPVNYDGGEDAEHNIYTRLDFSIAFNTWQNIVIDLFIMVMATVLICFELILYDAFPGKNICKSLRGRLADKQVKVQTLLRCILNPIIAVVTVILLYIVFPRQTFTKEPKDIVFYYIGILLLSVLFLYGVNYKRREGKTASLVKSDLYECIKNCLTVISVAMVIWYCFEYMNGLYDISHAYSSRRILIWFLIMLVITFEKDELLTIFNGIWAVAGIPIGYLYARPYIGMQEEELLYKLNAWIIYMGGFVLINIIRSVIRAIRNKKIAGRLYLPYAIPFFIMLMMLVIKANTRWWPGYLLAVCVLLIIRLLFWEKADGFVKLLCDGVLLNFVFMVVFSLLHRPYYGYIYHRYNMTYFTVTMTATHLAMVIIAAAVRLYIRYKHTEDIRATIPDMALFGTACVYEIMTLSRTGYVTVAASILAALIFIVLTDSEKGKRFTDAVVYITAMIVSVAVMFPITFTFTRILPPLNDDPVIYDYEPSIVTIYKGTEPDNEYYMALDRFIDVFGSKVLDIGDSTAQADRGIMIREENIIYLADAGDAGLEDIDDQGDDADLSELDEEEDVSNGRFDIYRSYIEQSDMAGHDKMGAILSDGSEASHAHNIYLQAIYDHGWVVGICVGLFLLYSVVIGMFRTKYKHMSEYMLMIPVITIGFMVAGLVEWILHPCNPYGLVLFMALSIMTIDAGTKRINSEKDEK